MSKHYAQVGDAGAQASRLSGFPRECAGSPFGDRFLLTLKAPAI